MEWSESQPKEEPVIGNFSYGDIIFIVVVSSGTALLVFLANRARRRDGDKRD